MQYVTNIHIKVNSPEVWLRFNDVKSTWINWADNWDKNFSWEWYAAKGYTDYIVETESGGGCTENELRELIIKISEVLGNDGIVISNTYNINVDPYEYCVYYIGWVFGWKNYHTDKHLSVGVDDIANWLNERKIWPNESEEEVLFWVGIIYKDKRYSSFEFGFDLSNILNFRKSVSGGKYYREIWDKLTEKAKTHAELQNALDGFKDRYTKLMKKYEKEEESQTKIKKIWTAKKLGDGICEITNYRGNDEDIVIPSVIGKNVVTSIGYKAFAPSQESVCINKDFRKNRLKSVEIPDGVTMINDRAFSGCSKLISIVIPESVTKIDELAFYNCENLTIHAPSGSYAEAYAKKKHIKFEAL